MRGAAERAPVTKRCEGPVGRKYRVATSTSLVRIEVTTSSARGDIPASLWPPQPRRPRRFQLHLDAVLGYSMVSAGFGAP
jgi:hypothetical protein